MIKQTNPPLAAIILGRSAENISSIIGEPVFEEQPSTSVTPCDIVFDNVTFAYDKRGNALENINLIFKERTINAIVGASGSGKSTIAHLIMGFWCFPLYFYLLTRRFFKAAVR